jgi:hypothetical protein
MCRNKKEDGKQERKYKRKKKIRLQLWLLVHSLRISYWLAAPAAPLPFGPVSMPFSPIQDTSP